MDAAALPFTSHSVNLSASQGTRYTILTAGCQFWRLTGLGRLLWKGRWMSGGTSFDQIVRVVGLLVVRSTKAPNSWKEPTDAAQPLTLLPQFYQVLVCLFEGPVLLCDSISFAVLSLSSVSQCSLPSLFSFVLSLIRICAHAQNNNKNHVHALTSSREQRWLSLLFSAPLH